MNTKQNPIRRAVRAAFEQLDARQLMSATSVKAVDSGGPDFDYVESNGHVIVLSSSASGAGQNQIWRTDGASNTSKLLVDAHVSDERIGSFDDVAVAGDGTVYFTATGGDAGGRQVFRLNVDRGGYTQVTAVEDAYFEQLTLIGTKLYLFDAGHDRVCTLNSSGNVVTLGAGNVTGMFRAKESLFYVLGSDGGLWKSDGQANDAVKVSGGLTFGASKVFGTNDYVYFLGGDGNNTSLYRTDGTSATPTKIADDFFIYSNQVAETQSAIYLSGAFYGSANVGLQVYRITTATGAVDAVTNLVQTNGGAAPEGLSAIGDNVYFTANDGGYINSAGTYDRELWRYNATSGTTKKVTTDETLYPIETSAGVLSSYYFVAAPTKADSRFGSRRLYRTSPTNDAVEEVAGLPSYTDSNGQTKQDVSLVFAASKGLFYSARNAEDDDHDYDSYFVPTPFTYVDPTTQQLIVTGTDSNDAMTLRADDDELIFTLNGVEERRAIGTFSGVRISMKSGDDTFAADDTVTTGLYVTGDSGNDTLRGGSGNDNLLAGAGKNKLFGGDGNDRLRGGGGQDYLYGEAGRDRLYGYGGSDFLQGGDDVDYLYGDDTIGVQGNDSLYGGSAKDRLYGRGGDDLLDGGKQADEIYGGDGVDTLNGQDGDDSLEGSTGADLINGGIGDDSLLDRDDADDVSLVEILA